MIAGSFSTGAASVGARPACPRAPARAQRRAPGAAGWVSVERAPDVARARTDDPQVLAGAGRVDTPGRPAGPAPIPADALLAEADDVDSFRWLPAAAPAR